MDYNLPEVEGIDWLVAHRYMPDKEVLLDVLGDFVDTADEQNDLLRKFRQDVEENPCEETYAAFRIQAHAMKATMRSMGSDLFDEALFLEEAGRDGRREDILEKTEDFTVHYKALADKMHRILGVGGQAADTSGFDQVRFYEKVGKIKEAMNAFDVSGLQDALKELLEMPIPEELSGEMTHLKEGIRDLDMDGVLACCERLEQRKAFL